MGAVSRCSTLIPIFTISLFSKKMVEAKVAKPAKAVPAKKAEAKDDSAEDQEGPLQVGQETVCQVVRQGNLHWLQTWIEEPTKTHLFFRLKAAPPKKTPGSTLERSVPSSTRVKGTKHLLATRPRNPRSARSGVKLLALMVAQEQFEPNSPQTSLLSLWDTVFA